MNRKRHSCPFWVWDKDGTSAADKEVKNDWSFSSKRCNYSRGSGVGEKCPDSSGALWEWLVGSWLEMYVWTWPIPMYVPNSRLPIKFTSSAIIRISIVEQLITSKCWVKIVDGKLLTILTNLRIYVSSLILFLCIFVTISYDTKLNGDVLTSKVSFSSRKVTTLKRGITGAIPTWSGTVKVRAMLTRQHLQNLPGKLFKKCLKCYWQSGNELDRIYWKNVP